MKDNFKFKKYFGQNFLKDNNVIDKIVNGASIDKETLVIEVGPGSGVLSKRIIPKSGFSILYEIDEELREHLLNYLKFDNYRIIFGDFLKADIGKDIVDYKYDKIYVVANLPYYITTPIINKLIDEVLPDRLVIMVQKEVADRLVANVGSKDYGSLTVFLNYYYDITKLMDVSRNCFVPSPNVDSSVIVMDLKKDRFFVKNIDLFKNLVRDSFQFKRKNIKNNLKKYDLEVVGSVLSKYGFDLGVRAEELDLEIFLELANELSK